MAQAITTKFAASTTNRGQRIIVSSWLGRTTYSWDHALDTGPNHAAAVREHIATLEAKVKENSNVTVHYKIVGDHADYWQWLGSNPKGDGYTAVVI